ncbi:MAG: hypothetical protein CMG74_11500 [Candidatus Marinimicrobia bacterium]|nr:hypothetical protein [Candidatus Neomarinimicrobiota bacterium]|tara:strand:+ start:75124 stop:75597 length:474 start_codon:yes stop_codon:yes gene_type:complete
MAIKERKGIKKTKNNSFIREYDYEILIILLLALGIFLLVEDLEIKQYLFLGLRWFLFSIGDIIKAISKNILLLKNVFEFSDLVGISLILYALYLVAKRWREREIKRYSNIKGCPDCGGKLQRIQRTRKQKIVSLIYSAKIKHYSCNNCTFTGIKMLT